MPVGPMSAFDFIFTMHYEIMDLHSLHLILLLLFFWLYVVSNFLS